MHSNCFHSKLFWTPHCRLLKDKCKKLLFYLRYLGEFSIFIKVLDTKISSEIYLSSPTHRLLPAFRNCLWIRNRMKWKRSRITLSRVRLKLGRAMIITTIKWKRPITLQNQHKFTLIPLRQCPFKWLKIILVLLKVKKKNVYNDLLARIKLQEKLDQK